MEETLIEERQEERVKFNLMVGVYGYEIHGKLLMLAPFYDYLNEELGSLDFLILPRVQSNQEDLFVLNMNKVFGLGSENPEEKVVLPGEGKKEI